MLWPLSSYNLLIFHKISICGTWYISCSTSHCWSLLYSAILHSQADSLRLRVILHEWIGLYSTFQYPPKWCAYSAGIADATWNCCHLGAFCVHHTTMHHVTLCSWTLMKKLAQKSSKAERWCCATERELDFFCFSCFPTAELRTVSLWLCSAQQLGQQLRGAVVAAQCRTDTALTSCCSGGSPQQPQSSRLAPVSKFHSSVLLFHLSPSLIGLLVSVDIKQQKSINQPALLAEWLGSFTCYCGNTGVEQIMKQIM